jgi:exodeoxyribonuclease VII large subunit
MSRTLVHSRHRLSTLVGRLDSLSPLAVLGRGYSLTRRATGEVVRDAAHLAPGDAVEVLLGRGSLDCRVERTKERDDRPQV